MVIAGWYCCPKCKQKLLKVEKNAKANGIKIKCKKCREEVEIIISEQK